METLKPRYSKNGIIALCSLVYFVSYFSRKSFAAVMAGMLAEQVIEKPTAGLIGTFLFVFYGAGQLLSGYLGDKLKPVHLMLAGLFTTALCNLLMPLVPSGTLMIPVWGLNGLAQAMLWPPILKLLSTHLDYAKYTTASLIVIAASHVSTIVLYVFVPLCLSFWSWQTAFFAAAGLTCAAILTFVVLMRIVLPKEPSNQAPAPVQKNDAPTSSTYSLPSLLLHSGILPIFGCIIMCGFLRDGIESWLPTLYCEAFSREASESVLVSAMLPVFALISVSVITALHKNSFFQNEVRGAATLFLLSIVLCISLAALIEVKLPVARFVCLILAILICATMHAINMLLISFLPGRFAKMGKTATVGGLVNAFIYIGAATSMYGIALVSEHLGWFVTILSWIGVAAVGVAFAALAYRAYTKFIRENT